MKHHKSVTQFLSIINTDENYRKMFHEINLSRFIGIHNWPNLHKLLSSNLVVWLYRQSLLSADLVVKYTDSFELANGFIHYLFSDSLPIGYLLELPRNYQMDLTPSYVLLTHGKPNGPLKSVDDLPPVEHLANGQHLSVFTLGDAQIVASVNFNMVNFLK